MQKRWHNLTPASRKVKSSELMNCLLIRSMSITGCIFKNLHRFGRELPYITMEFNFILVGPKSSSVYIKKRKKSKVN